MIFWYFILQNQSGWKYISISIQYTPLKHKLGIFPVISRPTYYFKEILTSMLLLLHGNFYVKANEVWLWERLYFLRQFERFPKKVTLILSRKEEGVRMSFCFDELEVSVANSKFVKLRNYKKFREINFYKKK